MARVQLPDLTRAICHPKRPHAERGLCKQCVAKDARKAPTGLLAVQRKQQNELIELHKDVNHVERLALEAKAILREKLPAYAELHYKAAEIAAEKGDSRPTEWALQHIKTKEAPVVEPPAKEPVSTGVRVFVGIQMGGVPTETLPTIQVLPAETPTESV